MNYSVLFFIKLRFKGGIHMACFVATAVEAAVISAVRHTHERKMKNQLCSNQTTEHLQQTEYTSAPNIIYSDYLMSKLQKLSTLLWAEVSCFLLSISGTERLFHGFHFSPHLRIRTEFFRCCMRLLPSAPLWRLP